MTAAIVIPADFTVSGSSATIAGSATSHLANNTPGMVWRTGLSGAYVIVDLGNAASYDVVSLIGTNLRSSDTVRVRTGATGTGIGASDSTAIPAWTGVKPMFGSAMSIVMLPASRTERYVRIDIAAPSHPDGYIEVQRLCIGGKVTTAGLQVGAERTTLDRGETITGNGYEVYDEYDAIQQWKFKTAWIKDSDWRASWLSIQAWAGRSRPVLFIPDTATPDAWIGDAIWGRLKGAGKSEVYDAYVFDGSVTALGA